ncbi:MAG: TMEM175 family protein [Candidatus Dormibacteria bacterium]
MTTKTERLPNDPGVAETGRTEAFSDGVLAIALTLLVLNLSVPASQSGDLAYAVLRLWPSYVSFLASFVYIAVIWLNHHAAFRRIRSVDSVLIWANMGLLLGAVIVPFPTAVLANAFSSGNRASEQVAVALYASVGVFMAATWFAFFLSLDRRNHLAHESVAPSVWRAERCRAVTGLLGYAVAGAVGMLLLPSIGLILFCVLPVFYALSSEGLPGRRMLASHGKRS